MATLESGRAKVVDADDAPPPQKMTAGNGVQPARPCLTLPAEATDPEDNNRQGRYSPSKPPYLFRPKPQELFQRLRTQYRHTQNLVAYHNNVSTLKQHF